MIPFGSLFRRRVPLPGTRRLVLGWSRTVVEVEASAVVLDVGCGSFPNPAATIACDRSVGEDRQRTGRATVVDRPFVICDAEALPFRDGSIDFVIASHIAEHVDVPEVFCAELARVARRGYVETPSPLADYLLDEPYHQWRVGGDRRWTGRGGRAGLTFRRKPEKSALARWLTDRFAMAYYAGRTVGSPTYALPSGVPGRVIGRGLLVARALLNRSGVMHTRCAFAETAPLTWRVERDEIGATPPPVPRTVVVERDRASGFLASDRSSLEATGEIERVVYPGRPTWSFLRSLWSAVGRSTSVYTCFASEHALLGGLAARLRGRRFVVTVGGYDVAAVPEHGYGLAGSWHTRWLPLLVVRLADEVLAMSESAHAETSDLVPRRRVSVVPWGLDAEDWPLEPAVVRDPGRVVTVGYVDRSSWSRKGFDRFVGAARRDPDRNYVLIGRVSDEVENLYLRDLPANLTITGYVSDAELRDLLWSSGVYCQLSWHEGFGFSMAEAMLCGCRPVISTIPALREVSGGLGVESLGSDDDVRAIVRAATEPVDRSRLRRWVLDAYPLDRRARALRAAVTGELAA